MFYLVQSISIEVINTSKNNAAQVLAIHCGNLGITLFCLLMLDLMTIDFNLGNCTCQLFCII
jgi:hypothetical protein